MSQSLDNIAIIGAGITGLMTAYTLLKRGFKPTIFEAGKPDLHHGCSAAAAGMLSPTSELETAEELIGALGTDSLGLWSQVTADLGDEVYHQQKGTLVIAHHQDQPELERLTRQLNSHHQDIRKVNRKEIRSLEPALEDRFSIGLFIENEGQIEPRTLLPALARYLQSQGIKIYFSIQVSAPTSNTLSINGLNQSFDWVIDCRGLAARDQIPELRAVKGEVATIRCPDITLNRMIRLMHPRYPLYIVPRPDHHFLIGATSIETEDYSVTVRSALELLSAAYSLHPAFGEAEIVSLNAHTRPALPHNQPRIMTGDGLIRVNGLYRHGFLLAPALANHVADYLESGRISNHYPELYESLT